MANDANVQNTTNERSAVITIADTPYELLLTTRATKEIAKRYGGLEDLGDKLMQAENFEMALDELCWLLALLANQPIQIHNLRHRDNPKPLLTEEEIELLTDPFELGSYKNAITQALFRGSKRHIESEGGLDGETPKNAAAE